MHLPPSRSTGCSVSEGGGGMEGCSKTSAGAAFGLPDDPLVEILTRLPDKPLCRFKCVSKAWGRLIADPRHRLLLQGMHGMFVQAFELSDDGSGRTSFSFVDLTAGSVRTDIDPGFSFLTEPTGLRDLFFLDSCNGLILLGHRQEPDELSSGVYVVCNPTTKRWTAVPACGSRAALSNAYLAFDPAVSSHFHLFQFQMPDVDELVVSLRVYSSETGTWSPNQLDEQAEQVQLEVWNRQFTLAPSDLNRAFVNGFLHVIVWGLDESILAVDVQGKARRMIALPGMADSRPGEVCVCYLGQSQGYLHFVTVNNQSHKISIWVLQDYGTQEWALKNTVDCKDVFGETELMLNFEVADIHQGCNVVFFIHQYDLIAYDMDRKEVTVIASFENNKCRSSFARYISYFKGSPALTN